MPPSRPLPFRQTVRKLLAAGFTQNRQRGSHVIFTKPTEGGSVTVVVPRKRELSVGILKSIILQAGLSAQEFEDL